VEARGREEEICRKVGTAKRRTISGNGSIPGRGERVE